MKILRIALILTGFIGLLFVSHSLFAVTYAPHVKPISPRVQAMGGAFSALANDSHLLFYNPAGIVHRSKYGTEKGEALLTVMELGWRGYKDYLQDYDLDAGDMALGLINPAEFVDRLDISGFKDNFNAINETSGESIQNRMNKYYGSGAQGPFHISYLAQGWGVSYLGGYSDISIRMTNGLLAKTSIYAYNTNILQAAYGIPLHLAGKELYIGVSVKYISLMYLDRQGLDSLSAASWPTNTEDPFTDMVLENSWYGTGPGLDIGFLWKVHKSVNLSLSVLNAPTYLLAQKSGLVTGEKNRFVAPVGIVGLMYEPQWFIEWLETSFIGEYLTGIRFLIDYEVDGRDIDEYWNFWYGWKMGMEISFWKYKGLRSLFFLRGGIHQGYFTGGAGIDLLYVKLDYAYFREEMGPKAGSLTQTTHNASLRIEW